MRWTAHSMCCSLLSLNARLFSWPLILVGVLSTSSRSPNYLKTISANLPPRHWEMKRKLFFLFCVRFRKAERGRWGQEMTKELITEVYSYFSPVHIFRDVRTKKSKALHKTSKGSKSQRSCNSGWWTSYEVLLFAAHIYVTFLQWICRWCHSSCVISFGRWLEEVEDTSFTGKYVPPCGWFVSENHSIVLKWCCFTMQ